MFTFGSQINPALGRQDFSAILQGGQARAQGIARAGEIQGQAIAQVAETLGKAGIQAAGTYFQNKEKNAVLEGKNAQLFNAIASDPATNAVINRSPTIQKLIAQRDQKGGLDLNNNTKLFAELSTSYEMVKESRENQRQQAYLAIQQQQAEIANERAAREKAEAARTLKVQQSFIDIAKNSPDTLKNPKDSFFAAISSGASVPEAIQMSNWAGSQQEAEMALVERNMNFSKRALELAELVRNNEKANLPPEFKVVTQDGVRIGYLQDQFGKVVASQIIGPAKPDQGEKLSAIARDYWVAKGQGDPVGVDKALANWKAALGRDGDLMSRNMQVEGIEAFGKGGDLEVTGLKRKEDSPSPSAEDKRVTQSPNPSQAASSMSLGGGYQPLANASAFQSPAASMGQPAAQAPSQAPATPAAPRPPVQDIVIPKLPAQDIVIPPSLPTQDIILDDAFVVRPGVSGSFKVDRDKAVASDDYEFGARGYSYLPKPGEKLNATQGAPILNRMEGELKLSKARLELLEPKAKDSADTLALKKIIPYLPNRALSMRLLKELSEGKQPSLSALNKDPFARSMLAAAKEGRLPQLNMAAIGRS
jgi:hypothetical protein